MKAIAAIVESVFDHATREINALELRIAKNDDESDDMLWEQARRVVALLDTGLTQRQLAATWINKKGEPYSQMHVSVTARLYREKYTFQPRPRWREAYFALSNATGNKITRFLHSSGDVEWYTPPNVIDAARDVLGAIDLDPASCDVANTVVQASQIYTEADNGLDQPWRGRVFLNPPYRYPDVLRFCEKFVHHVQAGDIQGIALVNNTTDTQAFRTLSAVGAAFCFPSLRFAFWKPDRDLNPALQGQVLVYSGPEATTFCRRFAEIGLVLVPPIAGVR